MGVTPRGVFTNSCVQWNQHDTEVFLNTPMLTARMPSPL
uniref:Uncharacterized protein n=1 Tax=Anguilla anguilla TaxID=7936 RepID=A0A0E9QC15_ANGAN